MKIDYSKYTPVTEVDGIMSITDSRGIMRFGAQEEMSKIHSAFIGGVEEGYRLAQQHFREMLGFPAEFGGSVMD